MVLGLILMLLNFFVHCGVSAWVKGAIGFEEVSVCFALNEYFVRGWL